MVVGQHYSLRNMQEKLEKFCFLYSLKLFIFFSFISATINPDKVPCNGEFKAVPFTFCNMSQNIFDLKKKRGRKRKLQNSGDCSLSRSGSCDEPLQFDEKIENLNQDQDTIETTLAMMIKTQEITTLTAHHEIIQEESPMLHASMSRTASGDAACLHVKCCFW